MGDDRDRKSKSTRRKIGILLLVLAYIAYFPSMWYPVVHMKPRFKIPKLSPGILRMGVSMGYLTQQAADALTKMSNDFGEGEQVKTIWGSAKVLWNDNNALLAILIILFSLGFPILKATGMLWAQLSNNPETVNCLVDNLRILSKWQMADVFAVAMLIVMFSVTGSSPIYMEFGLGFYYYVAFNILSISASLAFPRIGRDYVSGVCRCGKGKQETVSDV